MFIRLLFLAYALGKLYASPIDPNRPLSQDTDSFLYTRDPASGAGDNLRTTYGIVWSCLVTILACVWSAVHPNIPGPYDAGWTILKRRMTTSFCALLAPELMVLWALRQHFAAKRIKEEYNSDLVDQGVWAVDPALDQSDAQGIVSARKAVNEWLSSTKGSIHEWFTKLPAKAAVRRKPRLIESRWGPVRGREPWTMTHGFFVQMGGFMLYEGEKPKKVLEFDAMCKMIKAGEIAAPTVTEAELKDRSKGNALSKCVIVLQTSWFVVQCLARLASHLPLSELEVVTLAFAVMNGIVYWVWWDKPQGVEIAIPIHLQCPDAHGSDPTDAMAGEIPATSGLNLEELSETRSRSYQEASGMGAQMNEATQLLNDPMNDTNAQNTSSLQTVPSEEPFQTYYSATESQTHTLINIGSETESLASSTPPMTSRSTNLWKTPKSFLVKIFAVMEYPLSQLGHMIVDDHIPDDAMSVPIFYFYDDSTELTWIAAFFIGTLFGAVHFFAWASVFPSPAEKIIWHVSVLTATAGPLLVLLALFIGAELADWLGNIPEKIALLIIVTSVPYVLGRIALLTVALLSLRALPKDAFVQISWTSFIPHF